MIEQAERSVKFQEFLDEITKNELEHFPDVETDGDKIANILNNLAGLLASEDNMAFKELAKILGISADQLPHIYTNGMPNDKLKKRLNRTFACTTIWMRIYENPKERLRMLTFPQPFLHHKTPIDSLKGGNVDKVLYFTAMSGLRLNLE